MVVDALIAEHGGDRGNVAGLDVEVLESFDQDRPTWPTRCEGADVVFNLAGQVSHLASMQQPLRDLELNLVSHVAFLETLRRRSPHGDRRVDLDASGLRTPQYLPVDEGHPTAPVDVNGIDKLACEQFHLLYSNVARHARSSSCA